MKTILLTFTTAVMLCASVWAQPNIRTEIAGKEKELADLDRKRDQLLQTLETLRLKRNIYDLKQMGLPVLKDSGNTYSHSAYVFNYNEPAEQPNWVAHIISPEIEGGIITRTNDFRVDTLVKTGTANKTDYWQSGYDRGHLAPS
eukprot:gene16580-21171_t